MFTKFWGEKGPNNFITEKSYVTIEFLTEDQKIQKGIIINQLQHQYKDDYETIIQYKDHFQCCFRQTIKLPFHTIMRLNQLKAHLQVMGGEIQQFLDNEVDTIIKVMQNNETVTSQSFINLFDQMDTYIYTPNNVIEIIISKKSRWNILKYKAKKVVKTIPGYLASLLWKIANYFLGLMGISSTSLIMKMLPMKMLVNWLLTILTIFFPPLGIFLGISKAII